MRHAPRWILAALALAIVPACGGSGDTINNITNTTTTTPPPTGTPTFAPDVVFEMKKDGTSPIPELWGADLYGIQMVRLSDSMQAGANILGWSWSPDRKWLAFIADREFDNAFAVYVLRTTGPGVPIRASSLYANIVAELDWAPDSSYVAYRAGATEDLYTVKPEDPTTEVQVSGTLVAGGAIAKVAWAPDSSRIAYSADQDTDGKVELYTSTPDGSSNVKVSGSILTSINAIDPDHFAWAPNSSRLAYVADGNTTSLNELYTTLPTSAAGAVRVNPAASTFFETVDRFQWSPSSLFIGYTINPINNELHTSPPAAAPGLKVSGATPIASDWKWSPNGMKLAFRSAGQLYSVDAAGGLISTVNGPLVAGGAVSGFSWAPNSLKIAYSADQDTDDVYEIYTSSSTGSANVKVSTPLGGGDASGPSWSADSQYIAYSGNPGGSYYQIFVTTPTDAASVFQLTSVVAAGSPNGKWTTTGAHFIFTAAQDVVGYDDLYAGDPATGGVLKLSGPWVSGQSNVYNFTPR